MRRVKFRENNPKDSRDVRANNSPRQRRGKFVAPEKRKRRLYLLQFIIKCVYWKYYFIFLFKFSLVKFYELTKLDRGEWETLRRGCIPSLSHPWDGTTVDFDLPFERF